MTAATNEQSQSQQDSPSNGDSPNNNIHNGPTSIWIPEDASNNNISTLRGDDETSSSMNSLEWSMASTSASSDLAKFSRRTSELSGEARQLKPAAVLESTRRSCRLFPVCRLRFANVGLVGRDEEKKLLEESLKRVACQDEKSRELILISGTAGTGKTALATTLAKSVKRMGGLYVKGKFDLFLRDEPYAGIADACREICGSILVVRNEDSDSFEVIRSELVDKLGSANLSLLINIIPELAEIVGDNPIMEDTMKKQGNEEAKARFNYAFRILLRVVTRFFPPLVILLDDLQWSDAATLDLLQVIIADHENPSLMVIGIYRSNEVDETHPLSPIILETKRTSKEQDDFVLTEIEVGNLNVSQIDEVIMRLLSMDESEKTLGLAHVCDKRTYGNVFSLLIFLKMLQAEGFLTYSLGTLKWDWDEQQILSETAATSNVVDLMKQKIEKLPPSVGQRLSIAACLGFSFEPAILDTVWTTIRKQRASTKDETAPNGEEDDGIESFLTLVEEEGFLEVKPDSDSVYRWVHDKVQEAAMSLVPSDELPDLKAQVGKILVDTLDENALDSYIFTVVNLLNEQDIPEDELERIQLAELALRALKKAKDQSAFESAGKYAAIGVEALPPNSWNDYYALTLDLYSEAAEVEGFLGHTDRLGPLYNEVMEQKDRPLSDKLRVYHAMISYKLGALGKPIDAIAPIEELLAQYGVRFPKMKATRLLATLSGLRKAKKKMSSLRPEDINALPMMDDHAHLESMLLLDQLFIASYRSASDLMPLTIFARIKLTLEHGISEYAVHSFACLALVFRDDPALASKIGGFARLVMARIECKHVHAKAEVWLSALVFCWTDPIARIMPRVLKAYETGLSVGDNENACWNIAQYIVVGFQSGKSLETVHGDCEIYLKQMIEFKREVVHADISVFYEMIGNLMGRNDGDPTVMKSEERFLSYSDQDVRLIFYTCQSALYLFFGEYEKGAELAIERGDSYAEGIPGHVLTMIETFDRAMLLFVEAQHTRKRSYRKVAKRIHKTIKSWVRKGNPNVQHYDLLLNAEAAVLDRKLDAAERWYQSAIVAATRNGSIHESALASERYCEFLLKERNDPEEARHKFNDAVRRYREWGAAKKVQMLRDNYQDLWQKPSEVVVLSEASR